ncbi:chemotaxis protein CheW [Trichloromonas sp.]|uniref:chemotaxis protein CheW n=1 Tax=Trichloromonas sp. TaxID=3069249 RepID=UPI003D81AC7D
MSRSAGMNLVFRLGGSGFSLSVDDLVEIREEQGALRAGDGNSRGSYILGTLAYRGQQIPVVDLRGLLRISSDTVADELLTLLVLIGESGYWAVPVSRIEGIYPIADFSACHTPMLFMLPGPRPYNALEFWREEPLVRCEALWLEQFWCQA